MDGRVLRGRRADLEVPHRAKLLAVIKLLEELGPTLPFPYSSQVEGKLRELRTHYGETHYRVFYFGHRRGRSCWFMHS
ncbi:MAG: hypothetical protein DME13_19790 [Candidatus Rokuibacteriota bacterium]|nr:MAG: hypothetical protein DME13_19790 [Candidatus Rokubacteria bacterium]